MDGIRETGHWGRPEYEERHVRHDIAIEEERRRKLRKLALELGCTVKDLEDSMTEDDDEDEIVDLTEEDWLGL